MLKPRAAQIRSCTRQLSLGADLFKHFDLDAFFYLMHVAGMTYEDLYVMWMGKVTLNKFRQDNGYKEGTYIKTWDGGEDNVHLTAILKDLRSGDAINPAPENFESRVYNLLEEDYAVVKAG